MPTDRESAEEMYYELIKKQDNYIDEEHIVTYEEHELRTIVDVEQDRLHELMGEDK